MRLHERFRVQKRRAELPNPQPRQHHARGRPYREGGIRDRRRALVGLTRFPVPSVSEKQVGELDLDLRARRREHLRLLRRENGNTQRDPEETGGTREMSQLHEDLGLCVDDVTAERRVTCRPPTDCSTDCRPRPPTDLPTATADRRLPTAD